MVVSAPITPGQVRFCEWVLYCYMKFYLLRCLVDLDNSEFVVVIIG